MTSGCVQRCIEHYRGRIGGWRVLEVGPYNGRNTVHLAAAAREVVAIEPRLSNLRAAAEAVASHANVALLPGRADDLAGCFGFDLLFHCGVLYHLADPVAHWRGLAESFSRIWLNTHYAAGDRVRFRGLRGEAHKEPPGGLRAGLDGASFWMTRESLLALVGEAYTFEITWEEIEHPNGPRIELCCERKAESGERRAENKSPDS